MKLHHMILIAGALFAGGALAQDATELSDDEILRRFEAQLELRRQQQGASGTAPAADPLSDAVSRKFKGEVSAREAWTPSSGAVVGQGSILHVEPGPGSPLSNAAEVRLLRFNSVAEADHYLVHGDLEQQVQGSFMFEQRGEWVAVVAGPDMVDPATALEALVQAWNAATFADEIRRPPVRTRSARVGDSGIVIETEIDDEAFVRSYDALDYSGDPLAHTEFSDGVRRIHYGNDALVAYGQAVALSEIDRSPLRSRGDEGQFGRTRGLTIGGDRPATQGLGTLLEGTAGGN
ncbi:MAG: hypothetical protein KDD82_11740 [Planctomycetes bacterium]|nr:hypothetical protein [Planctomycetota bacterium]